MGNLWQSGDEADCATVPDAGKADDELYDWPAEHGLRPHPDTGTSCPGRTTARRSPSRPSRSARGRARPSSAGRT
nr:hypothetical protein [Streptomyces aureocirculatus]